MPEDFPPIGCHELITDPKGGRLVAPGPTPVYVERSLLRRGWNCSELSGYGELRAARTGWLAMWLGEDARARLDAVDAPSTIVWKDREAIAAAVRDLEAATERSWRAVVTACVDATVLPSAAAAGEPPPIHVDFCDLREDRRVPLPELPRRRR